VSAEGVLKEALTRLWEQARGKRFERVTRLDLRLFDAGDAFKLLGPIGSVPKAEKEVRLEGTYGTAEGSTFEFTFQGKASDAQPVKDFLDPQLRAAAEKEVSATFTLRFADGLPLAGEEPEKLTERLSRFGAGAAYVTATAEDTP
jgi:alkanesulfonate monooxygenase SsuD/methylene tetrahydromethanopterin reductase-like flavin-dependent oxidoreductase (luciferase family)